MKLALGSDHAGFEAKQIVEEHLREKAMRSWTRAHLAASP